MAVLKWIVIGVASLVGGYFGYRLTGSWIGTPIVAAAIGFAGAKLLSGEWVLAFMAICVGAGAIFHFLGSGAPETARASTPQALQGSANQDTSPASKAVAASPESSTPASDTGMKVGSIVKDCAECPDLVLLPAGQFVMGSLLNAPGTPANGAESPQRKVAVQGFAMGQDAVTKGEFAAFAKATNHETDAERLGGCFALSNEKWEFKPKLSWRKPGIAQTDNHPAVCVTWNDATAYAVWLSTVSRKTYRLPTEAEREYATRAGTTLAYWWGESATMAQANFHGPASGQKDTDKTAWRRTTVPTHQFAANPFGLYNVHGNVWEWVQDCHHVNYVAAPADATAWTQNCAGTKRGLRGGGWTSRANDMRSASRIGLEPDMPSQGIGFRIARDLDNARGPAIGAKPSTVTKP